MLPNVGLGELIIILILVLLFFGAKKLPEMAKGLGKAIQAFRKELKNGPAESETPREQKAAKKKDQ